MSVSSDLAEFVKQSKKDKRLESKKKKTLALLKLFEMNQESPSGEAENENGHAPSKKPRTEIVPDSASNPKAGSSKESEPMVEYAKAKQLQMELQQKASENAMKRHPQRYGPTICIALQNALPFYTVEEGEEGQKKMEERLPPFFILDLQHLLLLALLKNFTFWIPRWCRLNRPRKLTSVVLIVLKDVSVTDFHLYPDCFPCLGNSFLKCVEMVSPTQYNSSIEQDMCSVPLSVAQMKRYTNREDVRQRVMRLISKPESGLTRENRQTERRENFMESSAADEKNTSLENSAPVVQTDYVENSALIDRVENPAPIQTGDHVKETDCHMTDSKNTFQNSTPGIEKNSRTEEERTLENSVVEKEEKIQNWYSTLVAKKLEQQQQFAKMVGLEGSGGNETGEEIVDENVAFEDQFPRTSLLLSTLQLMEEGYPMPVDTRNKRFSPDKGYVFTKDKYAPVTTSSPLFAVDCEMVHTGVSDFELTRVSIVNEKKEVIYDQLVKPYNPITNYLTQYSGMTKELLDPVTTRIQDVQRAIQKLLPPDAILCGQSLWNDLCALKLFHPYIIDTAIIFNQSGEKKIRMGLRKLTNNFLGRVIQASKTGHCSIEDARAVMDLVKLKLSKNIEYGDAMLGGVYFPDITTYFQQPHKAQNVQETFSSPYETFDALTAHSFPQTADAVVRKNVKETKKEECQESDIASEASCKGLNPKSVRPDPEKCTNSHSEQGHKRKSNAELVNPVESVSDSVQSIEHETQCEDRSRFAPIVGEGFRNKADSTLNADKTKSNSQGTSLVGFDFTVQSSNLTEKGDCGELEDGEELADGEGKSKSNTREEEKSKTDTRMNEKRKWMDDGSMSESEEDMERRRVFFSQEGSTLMFNFFEVLADNKVSAGVIGSRSLVSKLEHLHLPRLERKVVTSDDDVCSSLSKLHRDVDFTWVELNHFSTYLDTEQGQATTDEEAGVRKAKLLQMDERVRTLVNSLQERTLVTVVMSGRYSQSSGQHHNAATFVKTTW